MGGIARAISKVFSKPKAAPVQKVAQTVTNKAATAKKKAVNAIAGGYGSGSTMLTGSGGVTEEANVAKTMLGEGMAKAKKKMYG